MIVHFTKFTLSSRKNARTRVSVLVTLLYPIQSIRRNCFKHHTVFAFAYIHIFFAVPRAKEIMKI